MGRSNAHPHRFCVCDGLPADYGDERSRSIGSRRQARVTNDLDDARLSRLRNQGVRVAPGRQKWFTVAGVHSETLKEFEFVPLRSIDMPRLAIWLNHPHVS